MDLACFMLVAATAASMATYRRLVPHPDNVYHEAPSRDFVWHLACQPDAHGPGQHYAVAPCCAARIALQPVSSMAVLTCHLIHACAFAQSAAAASTTAEQAAAVAAYHAATDADEVDLALIEALLMYVCGEGPYARPNQAPGQLLGAILVFLPGALHYPLRMCGGDAAGWKQGMLRGAEAFTTCSSMSRSSEVDRAGVC